MNAVFRKIKLKILDALKQGWTPSAVCWSSAWGFTVGLFPIYGVTTGALGLIGLIWKLNHAIMQSFNYLIAPLKLILIIPYIRLGEWMFQTETPFSLSIPEFTRRFRAAPWDTLGEFAMTFLHAICGWLVSVPFWLGIVYFTMQALLKMGAATRKQIKEVSA